MRVIEDFYPHWDQLDIHESSPGSRGASTRLSTAPGYVPSQFFPEVPLGDSKDGVRCEDLRNLTFNDESFDLHITQDVMEHVFDPGSVFKEVARTLKPGGAHMSTVPLVKGAHEESLVRAHLEDGTIVHDLEPDYHGNPIDSSGSLVVTEWGYDICQRIHEASGLFTSVIKIDDLSQGIRAEYIEVLVTHKPAR